MLVNKFIIIILLLLVFNVHCFASVLQGISDIKLIEKNKSWNVYTATQGEQKLCYLLSSPTNNNKSNALFMVTYISKVFNEVSVSSGVKYKQKPLRLIIDHKKTYYLSIIENDIAWTESINTDAKIIDAMQKGLLLVVKGVSTSNKKIENSYSLLGFKKSYKKMQQICNY